MQQLSPFKYPMVIKQVNDLLIVSVPDLEITVVEPCTYDSLEKNKYAAFVNKITLRAMNQVIEKLRRFEKRGKLPAKPPSYIRQNLQTSDNETLSTATAAKYLQISQATLKRWELRGIIHACKSAGGHRNFRLDELNRLLKQMQNGEKLMALSPLSNPEL
jgi:excisionase family DNA binding protein